MVQIWYTSAQKLIIVWHHAGPYDAAAPSRNKNLPETKAPMRAFPEQAAAAAAAAPSPQRKEQPTQPAVQHATPPIPPTKDTEQGPTKRAQAALRERPTHSAQRRTSGGLTGQYSTSVPSGGYFASVMDEPMSEAALAQRERQREREQKRRALKAAWGIDERKSKPL